MKNGDPHKIIQTGKVALGMLDWCVPTDPTSLRIAYSLVASLGQSPWLLDILWHMPATKNMHTLEHLAATMMQRRMRSKDLPEFRDLSSYLVSSLLFRTFSGLIDFT